MIKKLKFYKMEGLGNDFIIVHEIPESDIQQVASLASMLCDRHKGIGADGLVFVLPSGKADFQMVIYNSDGSRAEMCGNAIRCVALYVNKMKLTKLHDLSIETLAGIKKTQKLSKLSVRVNMGVPILYAPEVPVNTTESRYIMRDLTIGNTTFKINAISMGNPHAVIYTNALTDDLVLKFGPEIEKHPIFPKKTNVEFVRIISKKEVVMRVWERGCGETQACGTGACASAVSGIINKLHDNDVTVHLPGGDLQISWSGDEKDSVMMSGPARFIYKGVYDLKG
jgi:diaminopimelate epimerase